jgi:hypothetical protein
VTASDAIVWLAQAHWERGRPDEARELITTLPPSERRPVECAWMELHVTVTLDLLQELFPDLDSLRQGRALRIWRRQITLASVPNGDRLGPDWDYLLLLTQLGDVPPPASPSHYLRQLYEATLSRAIVEAPAR